MELQNSAEQTVLNQNKQEEQGLFNFSLVNQQSTRCKSMIVKKDANLAYGKLDKLNII